MSNLLEKFYLDIYQKDLLPKNHINYLESLKKTRI